MPKVHEQEPLRRTVSLALLTTMFFSATMVAQTPKPVDLRGRLTRGERISVELKDGRRIDGTVGDRFNNGFYVEYPPAEPTFIRYGDVRALHDPDDAAILLEIAAPDPRDKRWVKPVLITAAIVAAVAVLTHGVIPLCIFQKCN